MAYLKHFFCIGIFQFFTGIKTQYIFRDKMHICLPISIQTYGWGGSNFESIIIEFLTKRCMDL